VRQTGAPTAILAQTVKGWALGPSVEARNITHQAKKMSFEELKIFRDRLELPISDDKLTEDPPYYHPGPDSPEVQYMIERRRALGGFVPRRVVRSKPMQQPEAAAFAEFPKGSGTAAASTTMAFTRLLRNLLRDKNVGKRIVPIIPDEARTFGMDPLFKEVGIYSPLGQRYEPVDAETLLPYREAIDGQVLEEGITEAGSMASFTAAGTSYATHGEQMLPFYVFYSMFGMQRTGDQMWAFGDARGRGFLCGATAGRTTLNGEGLQHEDGHSQLLATSIPNIRAYDPAFAYETAVIVRDGMKRMLGDGEAIFYYLTLYNENYPQPAMTEGVEEGIVRGIYLFRPGEEGRRRRVTLLGSGSIMQQVLRAQQLLQEKYDVSADVYSVTSYQQLRNEALAVERWNRLHPESEPRLPHVTSVLGGHSPIVAASDWLKALPDQISRWVGSPFVPLGTDGFGRSDTREALRRHFEIDAESVATASLHALALTEEYGAAEVAKALAELGIDPEKPEPRTA
ncbi:MAG TPA: pyruvate dehydrogenase (acetyl-transferring), homodimeric type, partial [Candidatus Limnocylindria bacterium]